MLPPAPLVIPPIMSGRSPPGGGGSPSNSHPPQPQFQCDLKKIFLRRLWRLVFAMLFGLSDGSPHGGVYYRSPGCGWGPRVSWSVLGRVMAAHSCPSRGRRRPHTDDAPAPAASQGHTQSSASSSTRGPVARRHCQASVSVGRTPIAVGQAQTAVRYAPTAIGYAPLSVSPIAVGYAHRRRLRQWPSVACQAPGRRTTTRTRCAVHWSTCQPSVRATRGGGCARSRSCRQARLATGQDPHRRPQ